MKRKLFCEISPTTYKISVLKCKVVKVIKDFFSTTRFARSRVDQVLPIVIYKHNSLIRRQLGEVDMTLQNNKAINLSLVAPKVTQVVIKPGETFSFWKLVGSLTASKGYKEGLTISGGKVTSGVGGGMCQFTNLIHWMVLHTPMEIVEHHHHDGFDLFPDFNRQIPFGTGTSILYNYLDYRFKNTTDLTYQLVVYTNDEYLCGELRADKSQSIQYHIKVEKEEFVQEAADIYRTGEVYREGIDRVTGAHISRELLRKNHAKVMYDIVQNAVG